MKPDNGNKSTAANKIIVGILIVQTIGSIVLAIFAFNFILDPNSKFNQQIADQIKSYVKSLAPTVVVEEGTPGIAGTKGDKGDTGATGAKGDKGDKGDTGDGGANGQSIQGEKGDKGDQGEPGVQGIQGERADFRCNPDTAREEYKYPSDEDWMETGGACFPVLGR